MTLVGAFFPDGSDGAEEEVQKALMAFLPRRVVGAFLNGVPWHALGIDLQARIGMPELWFRSSTRDLEGEDQFNYWQHQLLGAVPNIALNAYKGAGTAMEGAKEGDGMKIYRGFETMAPKLIRDAMKSGRFLAGGAQTYSGDPVVERFNPVEIIAQAIGFTPEVLSERYQANTRMKNKEKRSPTGKADSCGKRQSMSLPGRT